MLNTVLYIRANFIMLALILGLCNCHGRHTRPPYPKERPPLPATLISAIQPRLQSLRVQSGKIKQDLQPHAGLLLIAQLPMRLRATVHFSGQEILTLAINEKSYGLRYLQEQNLPRGYYHGPPADCAVSELLGIAIPAEDLVRLILGGGPKISQRPAVLDQSWSGKHGGFERIVIQDGPYQRELRFSWIRNSWWFQGMSTRKMGSNLAPKKWEWSIDHQRFTEFGDFVVPTRTVISRPGKRRRTEVKIVFNEVQINPTFLGKTHNTGESDDDDWDDEDWEDAEGPATISEQQSINATVSTDISTKASLGSSIPVVFVLDSAGLLERGDLCGPRSN